MAKWHLEIVAGSYQLEVSLILFAKTGLLPMILRPTLVFFKSYIFVYLFTSSALQQRTKLHSHQLLN